MSDNKGWSIGQYDEGPPQFNYGAYKTLAELISYTGGLLDDMFHDRPWYEFESAIITAMKGLDDVNNAFEKKITEVGDMMKGESADAFKNWGKDVLAKSRALHDRVSADSFHLAIGNIGHTIRWFYDHWWSTVADAADHFTKNKDKIRDAAYKAAELATSGSDLDAIVAKTNEALDNLGKENEAYLIDKLKSSFDSLGEQY